MYKKNNEILLNSSPETLKGIYTNAVRVLVTDNEVIIDFALIYPEDERKNEGVINSRIIMAHKTANLLSDSIHKTFKEHEDKTKK